MNRCIVYQPMCYVQGMKRANVQRCCYFLGLWVWFMLMLYLLPESNKVDSCSSIKEWIQNFDISDSFVHFKTFIMINQTISYRWHSCSKLLNFCRIVPVLIMLCYLLHCIQLFSFNLVYFSEIIPVWSVW